MKVIQIILVCSLSLIFFIPVNAESPVPTFSDEGWELLPDGDKAIELTKHGKHEEALVYYDKALTKLPDNYLFLSNKAVSLASLERYDEALQIVNNLLEKDPDDVNQLTNKGVILFDLGNYQDAITYFDKALELDPTDQTAINNKNEAIQKLENNSEGGGCLIATATFDSELSPQVQQLRELRDNKLLQTEWGLAFMESFNDLYYSFSPTIADYERENPLFKEAVKIAITPMISFLSILNHVDMDTEAEALGYGISLILLNLGMYVGIPVVVVIGIRKNFKNII